MSKRYNKLHGKSKGNKKNNSYQGDNFKGFVKNKNQRVAPATLSDFHVHIEDNADGVYQISDVLKMFIKKNVTNGCFLQHNSLNQWCNFVKEHNLDETRAKYLINGINVSPAVEITCRDNENINLKGNSVKLHLVVLAPTLTEDSPLVNLLKIKSQNDEYVDYGLLNYVANVNGIVLDKSTIKDYVISRRQENPGFNTFGANDCSMFFEKNKIVVAKSQAELTRTIKEAPAVQRLNLDLKDVIEVAHASGGLVILAHPPVNLNRTIYPETTIQNFLKNGGDGFEIITNSMNEKTFGLITSEVKNFNGPNKILFTGGSDIHLASNGISVGKTLTGFISETSQREVINELQELDSAREQGLITHREYEPISPSHINEILDKYTEMASSYADTYENSKNNSIEENNIEEPPLFADTLSPTAFKTFQAYMSACSVQDESAKTWLKINEQNVNNIENLEGDFEQ